MRRVEGGASAGSSFGDVSAGAGARQMSAELNIACVNFMGKASLRSISACFDHLADKVVEAAKVHAA